MAINPERRAKMPRVPVIPAITVERVAKMPHTTEIKRGTLSFHLKYAKKAPSLMKVPHASIEVYSTNASTSISTNNSGSMSAFTSTMVATG